MLSLLFVITQWVFILFIPHCPQVKGLLIKPEANLEGTYTYCMGSSDKQLQFEDPFNPNTVQDEKFISISWYFIKSGETSEKLLLENVKGEGLVPSDQPEKYTLYGSLGLQVQNINFEDSGTYRATLVLTSGDSMVDTPVIISKPPQLNSEKLSLTEEIDEISQSKTLKCGEIGDLGVPPVEVHLKAGDTVLPAEFVNGYMVATLDAGETGTKFTCDLDSSSPAGECIAEEDKPRWEGSVVNTSRSGSADMTGIIIGVIAAVVIGIIIIIVLIILIMKRKKKGDKYNTKAHEARAEAGNNDKDSPLLSDSEYDTPRNRKPIYTGPANTTTNPYMVSPVHQNIDPVSKKIKPPVATPDDEDERQPFNSVKYSKKDQGQDTDKKNETKPGTPRAKPRSIFLTGSSEELDKIGRAVAGGEGSGAKNDGTMV